MTVLGLVASLQISVYWSTVVCSFELHTIDLKIRNVGMPKEGSFRSEKTKRLVECVYSCIQHTDCSSLGYNKTSAMCHLYPSHTYSKQINSGTLFANLRDEKIKPNQTKQISPERRRKFVLKPGKMIWMKAAHKCGRLMEVHNEIDQAAAVKVLNGSGLECVAIGAFKPTFKWKTTGGYKSLLYSDWGEGEPSKGDRFGCLSKRYGYKWEGRTMFEYPDAVLCELFV